MLVFARCYILKVNEYDLNEEDLNKTHFFDLAFYIMNYMEYYNLPEINNDSDLVNCVKSTDYLKLRKHM